MSGTDLEREQQEALVYVVDDDKSIRDAMAQYFQSEGQMRVQGYATGEEFLQGYEDRGPGCLVLDMINKLGMSGTALLRKLRERENALPAIVITGRPQWQDALEVMKLGAFDYLEKPIHVSALMDLVRQAIQREQANRAHRLKRKDTVARLEKLTDREQEILRHILEDRSSTEIATALGISPKTIEYHRTNVLLKMDVKTTIQLVRRVGQVEADSTWRPTSAENQ